MIDSNSQFGTVGFFDSRKKIPPPKKNQQTKHDFMVSNARSSGDANDIAILRDGGSN